MQHWPHDYAARSDTSLKGNEIEISWNQWKSFQQSIAMASIAKLRLHLSRWSNWCPLQAYDLCSQNHHRHQYLSQEFKLSLCLRPYWSPKSPRWPRTTSKNNTFCRSLDLQSTNGLEMKRKASRIWSGWRPQVIETFVYSQYNCIYNHILYYIYIELSLIIIHYCMYVTSPWFLLQYITSYTGCASSEIRSNESTGSHSIFPFQACWQCYRIVQAWSPANLSGWHKGFRPTKANRKNIQKLWDFTTEYKLELVVWTESCGQDYTHFEKHRK